MTIFFLIFKNYLISIILINKIKEKLTMNNDIRINLQNDLDNKNYKQAFEKINENISKFCLNIQELQDYSLKIGSKYDNNEKNKKIELLIIETGDKISETFDLLKLIQDYNFNQRNEKIEYITEANSLEDKCQLFNKQFEDITNKIKTQNLNIIKRAKSSIRSSNFSNLDMPVYDENNINDNNIKNGNEFLDGIINKRKQNDLIDKANYKIRESIGRISLKKNFNHNSNNNFSDDELPFRFKKDLNESMRIKIEKKLFESLDGPRINFLSKHKYKIIVSIIICIIVFIIMLI